MNLICGSFYFSLSLLFAMLFGFSGYAAAADDDKKEIPLVQDVNALSSPDGKIIQQKQIKIESEYSNGVNCYQIQYISDGLNVVGFVLIPQSVGGKFPVLIFNRGGYGERAKISSRNALKYLHYLASEGYVVLASQYRGSDGGQGNDEFGGKDVNDILNLIPLAKSLPFADSDKIVMLGFFRGGMMTYLAIKEGAPIHAAAVVGGVRATNGNAGWHGIGQIVSERHLLGLRCRFGETNNRGYSGSSALARCRISGCDADADRRHRDEANPGTRWRSSGSGDSTESIGQRGICAAIC